MSDLRKAAEMALDALKNIRAWPETREAPHQTQAIEALRTALAQPEQEPVAWMEKNTLPLTHIIKSVVRREQDEQYTVPLYTAPPKLEWQGLTYDDKVKIHTMWVLNGKFEECVDFTESKLREKNT